MPVPAPGQPTLFGDDPGRAPAAAGPFARVALDTPVRREFSYRVPPEMAGLLAGCRVQVPFGARRLVGVVVGVDAHPPADVAPGRLRPLARLLDPAPMLTGGLLRLARQIADDTFCSWGQALAAMLPAALRRDRPRRTVPTVELLAAPDQAELERLAERFPKQERAIAWLKQAGGPVEVRDFCNRTGLSKSPLQTLAKKGVVRFGRRREFFDPFDGAAVPDVPPTLTPAQQTCVDAVCAALDARVHEDFLLHGITGSGKTEIYLQALERCLAQGRGAIVLVPEIALTPQTVARFRARAGEVAVLHSGLTDAERHDQWLALREGRLRVVVGARSALFAPIPELGLIVVDEEHETSFKQESTPRYHARKVAQERAELEGAVCVLGSATPSLETWAAALDGRVRLLELPERVAGGKLPSIEVVDMRSEKADKEHWLVISEPLRRELEGALSRGERGILFLNRRGFAPAWHCRGCGACVHCPACDVALTYHRWRKKAVCHYCMQEAPEPRSCKGCGGPVNLVGVGTERAEDTLKRMFPRARVARMDRDTMVRRESYEEVLGAFGAGELDLLLGTQMVAKGLDFPEVTVVGVLDADTALHHPDFRAAERCFDLICQVSGRAGRSDRGGKVVVQTWIPDHPAIRAAARHDFPGFARGELAEREEFGYPPSAGGVRLQFEAADLPKVERMAREARDLLLAVAAPGTQLLGPAAPPVEKLKGRWRRQILIKARPARALLPLHPALYELCQKQGVTVDRL
ncbi:MAG: primosomal protein N' [Planctomycetes bacterium]|nr:primosomal protein N' [Planctomycetota bacterium]